MSKFVGTGPSSCKKRIYRAAVSRRLRNTSLSRTLITVTVQLPWLRNSLLCDVISSFHGYQIANRPDRPLGALPASCKMWIGSFCILLTVHLGTILRFLLTTNLNFL